MPVKDFESLSPKENVLAGCMDSALSWSRSLFWWMGGLSLGLERSTAAASSHEKDCSTDGPLGGSELDLVATLEVSPGGALGSELPLLCRRFSNLAPCVGAVGKPVSNGDSKTVAVSSSSEPTSDDSINIKRFLMYLLSPDAAVYLVGAHIRDLRWARNDRMGSMCFPRSPLYERTSSGPNMFFRVELVSTGLFLAFGAIYGFDRGVSTTRRVQAI